MMKEKKLKVNSYLCLQLLFGENKASTFIKNHEKMITLILFDVEKEARSTDKPAGPTVVGIIDRLNETLYDWRNMRCQSL